MPLRTDRRWDNRSETSSSSGYSDTSDRSRLSNSTAATTYSRGPSVQQNQSKDSPSTEKKWDDYPYNDHVNPRSSAGTYASTIPSTEDLEEEFPAFYVPEHTYGQARTAIPSTSSDFPEYFPSTRRLHVRHDDSTLDGNMNLRVDTEIPAPEGRQLDLTLFHLRMHDLKSREFSLRRYCRDSGREVCHSSRKYTKPAAERKPVLQRSLSSALSSIRPKSSEARSSTTPGLNRHDSGYGSMPEDEAAEVMTKKNYGSLPLPTNTTQLEFSNYAHIDVKRRGTKSKKRYMFEYWGRSYAWKRVSRRDGDLKQISYHLINSDTKTSAAHIVPAVLTPAETQMEDAKGGWVPPCSLWISDEKIPYGQTDLAE